MSGVIDEYGQWEHCCQCGKFVLIQNLFYGKVRKDLVPKWPQYDKLDLCNKCVDPSDIPTKQTHYFIRKPQ